MICSSRWPGRATATMRAAMGQPVTVIEKHSTHGGLARYEVNRVLTGTGHEVYRAGQRVQLSPTEFKLLRYLMLNANRVLSKAQILDHVWKYDFRGDDNIVESYISYLRRKVDNVQPRLIHTLRGVGYVLRKPAT